jgi:hypothetical protein
VLREQPRGRRAYPAATTGHDRNPICEECAGTRCVVDRHIVDPFQYG